MKKNRTKIKPKKRVFQNGLLYLGSFESDCKPAFIPPVEKKKEVNEVVKEVNKNDDILYQFLNDAGLLLKLYLSYGTTEIFLTDMEAAALMKWCLSKLEREKRILRNKGYITECRFNEDLKAYSFLLKI